jgi:hypothetical protein
VGWQVIGMTAFPLIIKGEDQIKKTLLTKYVTLTVVNGLIIAYNDILWPSARKPE